MDLFAEVKGRVLAAVERLASEGRLPGGLDLSAVTVEPPRDPAHGDMATNAAMVLARPARMAPRDIAEALAGVLVARRASSRPRSRGRASSTCGSSPARWFGVVPAVLAAGDRLRPLDARGGAQGQRRVRLGQPDRADARRAHARRGVRRRAGGLLDFAG